MVERSDQHGSGQDIWPHLCAAVSQVHMSDLEQCTRLDNIAAIPPLQKFHVNVVPTAQLGIQCFFFLACSGEMSVGFQS